MFLVNILLQFLFRLLFRKKAHKGSAMLCVCVSFLAFTCFPVHLIATDPFNCNLVCRAVALKGDSTERKGEAETEVSQLISGMHHNSCGITRTHTLLLVGMWQGDLGFLSRGVKITDHYVLSAVAAAGLHLGLPGAWNLGESALQVHSSHSAPWQLDRQAPPTRSKMYSRNRVLCIGCASIPPRTAAVFLMAQIHFEFYKIKTGEDLMKNML